MLSVRRVLTAALLLSSASLTVVSASPAAGHRLVKLTNRGDLVDDAPTFTASCRVQDLATLDPASSLVLSLIAVPADFDVKHPVESDVQVISSASVIGQRVITESDSEVSFIVAQPNHISTYTLPHSIDQAKLMVQCSIQNADGETIENGVDRKEVSLQDADGKPVAFTPSSAPVASEKSAEAAITASAEEDEQPFHEQFASSEGHRHHQQQAEEEELQGINRSLIERQENLDSLKQQLQKLFEQRAHTQAANGDKPIDVAGIKGGADHDSSDHEVLAQKPVVAGVSGGADHDSSDHEVNAPSTPAFKAGVSGGADRDSSDHVFNAPATGDKPFVVGVSGGADHDSSDHSSQTESPFVVAQVKGGADHDSADHLQQSQQTQSVEAVPVKQQMTAAYVQDLLRSGAQAFPLGLNVEVPSAYSHGVGGVFGGANRDSTDRVIVDPLQRSQVVENPMQLGRAQVWGGADHDAADNMRYPVQTEDKPEETKPVEEKTQDSKPVIAAVFGGSKGSEGDVTAEQKQQAVEFMHKSNDASAAAHVDAPAATPAPEQQQQQQQQPVQLNIVQRLVDSIFSLFSMQPVEEMSVSQQSEEPSALAVKLHDQFGIPYALPNNQSNDVTPDVQIEHPQRRITFMFARSNSADEADVDEANFDEAALDDTDFNEADLNDVDFDEADFNEADESNVEEQAEIDAAVNSVSSSSEARDGEQFETPAIRTISDSKSTADEEQWSLLSTSFAIGMLFAFILSCFAATVFYTISRLSSKRAIAAQIEQLTQIKQQSVEQLV